MVLSICVIWEHEVTRNKYCAKKTIILISRKKKQAILAIVAEHIRF